MKSSSYSRVTVRYHWQELPQVSFLSQQTCSPLTLATVAGSKLLSLSDLSSLDNCRVNWNKHDTRLLSMFHFKACHSSCIFANLPKSHLAKITFVTLVNTKTGQSATKSSAICHRSTSFLFSMHATWIKRIIQHPLMLPQGNIKHQSYPPWQQVLMPFLFLFFSLKFFAVNIGWWAGCITNWPASRMHCVVSFSHFVKSSHNLICVEILMKESLGKGLAFTKAWQSGHIQNVL